jgi:hypothetical protein
MPAGELSRRDWGAHERAAATAIQSCEDDGAQDGDPIEDMAKLGMSVSDRYHRARWPIGTL